MFENVKANVPSKPSRNFIHNFWLGTQNLKQILVIKYNLIFHISSVQSFKKNHFIMPKQGLKYYFGYNSCFWLNYKRFDSYKSLFCIPHIGYFTSYVLTPHLCKDIVLSSLETPNEWLLKLRIIVLRVILIFWFFEILMPNFIKIKF